MRIRIWVRVRVRRRWFWWRSQSRSAHMPCKYVTEARNCGSERGRIVRLLKYCDFNCLVTCVVSYLCFSWSYDTLVLYILRLPKKTVTILFQNERLRKNKKVCFVKMNCTAGVSECLYPCFSYSSQNEASGPYRTNVKHLRCDGLIVRVSTITALLSLLATFIVKLNILCWPYFEDEKGQTYYSMYGTSLPWPSLLWTLTFDKK